MKIMTISVIIATKNRNKYLLNTIKSINLQTCLPDEIIIVDQNTSSDVKHAVFSMFNGLNNIKNNNIFLKYIHAPQITGLTQARNRGIEKNESDIVLFLDDDVILERDFIFNILEIYKKYPEVSGVSGIITNHQIGLIGTVFRKKFMVGNFADRRALIYTSPKKIDTEYITASILSGGLSSYRKEVFQEFKFDENFIKYSLCEDIDFSFRVSRKYKLVISPKARLKHIKSERLNDEKIIENEVCFWFYFFKKNLDKTIYNYIGLIWLNVGYIVFGILLAILRQRIDILVGYIKGLKIIINCKCSDFIQFYNTKY